MAPTQPLRGGPRRVRSSKFHSITGGKTKAVARTKRRHVPKDTIKGITKPDIRRLARRGGVKRISATIYDTTREALKAFLEKIIKDVVACCEYKQRNTVIVNDVIFCLRRIGHPIYGFDPDTWKPSKKIIVA